MIELKNIDFWFWNNKIIDNLSLKIWKNKICAIYWPSGTGKTTLLNIIWWLIKPNKGELIFENKILYSQNFDFICKYRNATVWYAFQNFNLLNDFSVQQNLDLPFLIWNISKDKDFEKYLIKFLEVKKLLNKKISIISWGERERISIIKSMIHKPKILLLDEPWTYLNKDLQNKIYDLMIEYTKNYWTVIFASHDEGTIDYFGLKQLNINKDIKIYI